MSLGSIGASSVGAAAPAAYGYASNAGGGDDHTERSDDSYRPPRIDLTSVREALDGVLNSISPTARSEYYRTLDSFLRAQLSKSESDYIIIKLLGAANIHYHNALIIGIIHNANSDELPSEKSGLHDDKHNDKADKADGGGKLHDKSDSGNNSSNNLHSKSLSKKDRKRLEREKAKENDRKRRDAKKAKKMFQATNANAIIGGLSVKTSIGDSSDESSSDDSEFAEENNLIIVNNAIDEMNNLQQAPPTIATQLDPTTLHIPTNYVTRWDQWKRLLERNGRQAEYNGILDYKIRPHSASQTATSKYVKSKYKVITNNNNKNHLSNANVSTNYLPVSTAAVTSDQSSYSAAILVSDTTVDDDEYHPRLDEDVGDVNSLFDRSVPSVNDIRRQLMFASAGAGVHYVERGVEQVVHNALQTHLQRLITSFAQFNETRHAYENTRRSHAETRRRPLAESAAPSITPMQLSPQIKPIKPSAFSSAATASLFAPRESLVKTESFDSVKATAQPTTEMTTEDAATAVFVTADTSDNASMDTMPPLSPVPRSQTPALAPTPPSPQPTTPTLASLLPPLPPHQRNALASSLATYRMSPTPTALSSAHNQHGAINIAAVNHSVHSRQLSTVTEDAANNNALQLFSLSDLIFAVECKSYRGRIAEDIEIMMQQMIIAIN